MLTHLFTLRQPGACQLLGAAILAALAVLQPLVAADITISAGNFKLTLDEQDGSLRSIVDTSLNRDYVDQETTVPLYQLVLKTKGQTKKEVINATEASLQVIERADDRAVLEFTHEKPRITVRVAIAVDGSGSRFRLSAKNGSEQAIISADFPGFVVKQVLSTDPADTAVIFPAGDCDERYWDMPREFAFAAAGQRNSQPEATDNNQETSDDSVESLEQVKVKWPITLTSGYTPDIVQMMAAYDPRGGLYVATHDPLGNSKLFSLQGVSKTGMRLAIEHLQSFRYGGAFSTDYDTVIAPTSGDWTASADIYRDWAKTQPWCARGTTKTRNDIPAWVKDYPVYLRFRLWNPNDPNQAEHYNPTRIAGYHPWDKVLETLDSMKTKYEGLSEGSIVHIEDWGWSGRWEGFYRERWPAFMGDDNLAKLIADIKQRGFRPGSQPWGWWTILKESNMKHLAEFWPQSTWWETDTEKPKLEKRPKMWHHLCIAGEEGRNIFVDDTRRLSPSGLDYLQIMEVRLGQRMDCFNPNHGHELGRGRWIAQTLHANFAAVRAEGKKHNPDFALDKEDPSEFLIDVTDLQWVRNAQGFHIRKNHSDFRERNNVPLYDYIYHEYQPLIDGFVDYSGPGDHSAMNYFAANAIALGHITGPLFGGYPGNPTFNQAEEAGSLELLRKGREVVRSYGKEYLTYGKVLPSPKCESPRVRYTATPRDKEGNVKKDSYTLPALVTSAHQADNGNIGLCIINTSRNSVRTNVPLEMYSRSLGPEAHLVIRRDHKLESSAALKGAESLLQLELGAGEILFIELKRSSRDSGR